jgi:hypothetical protein
MYDEKQYEQFTKTFFETLNKFIIGKEKVNLYLMYSNFEESFQKDGTEINILSNPQKIFEARNLLYTEKLQKVTELAKNLPGTEDISKKFEALTNSPEFLAINNKNVELAIICLPAITDTFTVQEINTTWDMLFAIDDVTRIKGLLITKPSYVVDNLAEKFLRNLNNQLSET